MRHHYGSINPKDSNLYTLKYKTIIEKANKGSKAQAIEIANSMLNEGKKLKKIGITLLIISIASFFGLAIYNFASFSSKALSGEYSFFTFFLILIPMIFIVISQLIAGRGSLIIKFSDYINTSDNRNEFDSIDNNSSFDSNSSFCDKCGSKVVSTSSVFCKSCGNKL